LAGNARTHLFPSPENMAACTDLYQLTMAAGYFAHDVHCRATFELFVRKLPKNRSYLVAAGLEQALHYLESLRFSRVTITYLRKQPAFAHIPREFFRYLAGFRFSGDVFAVPEGTAVFAGEPILSVRAPMIEAQIVETFLLTTLNYQTLVATKAARVVAAALGRPVADFGTRRAHGPQAGLLAARASYIGGCAATSNVLAGRELGIPITGTQAHSWVMAFGNEGEAFRRYAEVFPDTTVLLIDTYDTVAGARRAVEIGGRLKAVRLDSGDMVSLSRQVRQILDRAGLQAVKIIVSSDLNEYRIAEMLRRRAPIDMFGVGTEMVTSRDDPALSGVYKLVEIERRGRFVPVVKLSHGKSALPHLKQIRRRSNARGKFSGDTICLWREKLKGEALLKRFMRSGRIVRRLPSVHNIRARCREQIKQLPARLRTIRKGAAYPVRISARLRHAAETGARSIKR